jgi:plasmid stabilization system protein ParE
MRKVIISRLVDEQLSEIERYLQHKLHFSKQAARRRSDKIRGSVLRLHNPVFDTALCRFRRWHVLGYRCISFDGWVFAYEIVVDGVIVQDMAHSSVLADVVY